MRISAGGAKDFITGTTVFMGPMRISPTGATGLGGGERLLKQEQQYWRGQGGC